MVAKPYSFHTDRLVLRCYEPADAPLLKDCVDTSLAELRPWMPWALAEPQSLAEKVELLRGMRGKYDTDADHIIGMFDPETGRQLGGTGLHPTESSEVLTIGYFVRTDATGKGLATHATAVLTDAGLTLFGAQRIRIDVEPANAASLRIPRRLGYRELGIEPEACEYLDERRDVIRFEIGAADWDPALAPAYTAYDVLGGPVVPG